MAITIDPKTGRVASAEVSGRWEPNANTCSSTLSEARSGSSLTESGSVMDRAKDLAASAVEKTKDVASDLAARAGDAASAAGHKLEDAACAVKDKVRAGERYVQACGARGLCEDATNVIRRHPWPALAAGFTVGILLSRLRRT